MAITVPFPYLTLTVVNKELSPLVLSDVSGYPDSLRLFVGDQGVLAIAFPPDCPFVSMRDHMLVLVAHFLEFK
jgi:hypothetical protein